MHELHSSEFMLAAPLFEPARYGVLASGTLEGGHPGRVFVDRADSPTSALVCTRVGYYFLGGRPTNPEFNRWLYRAFTEEFAPDQFRAIDDPQVLMFYPSADWKEPLFQAFAGHGPVEVRKKRMVLPEALTAKGPTGFRCWMERIPPGFTLARMTGEFFDDHPEFSDELELFWGSIESFMQKSLGRCLVDTREGVIASACNAVFVGGGEAEISVQTLPVYRRQGLASLACQAFIEACLKRELKPVWGCFPENEASIALAKSLGFVQDIDQPICFWEWRN